MSGYPDERGYRDVVARAAEPAGPGIHPTYSPPGDEWLRAELPPMPTRIALLRKHRGYPVPWFVADVDGEPDFRVVKPGAIAEAHNFDLCWICGGKRGAWHAFVIGPMCAVNRISSEPPSHATCAQWSARACPFLTRPRMRRRDGRLPEDALPAAGNPIDRNPGVALVWIGRRYHAFRVREEHGGGVLFDVGEPDRVEWLCEGRDATRAEVEEAIESGLPALREPAEAQGPRAVAELERRLAAAKGLLPE